MAEEEKIAEAVSKALKRKEELRPIGKELVKTLAPENRRALAETLTEMTLDVMGDYKIAVLGPDTKVAVPAATVKKIKTESPNPPEELTIPERVEVLKHVEWSSDWARAMSEKFGPPEMTPKEKEAAYEKALEYLAREAWVA